MPRACVLTGCLPRPTSGRRRRREPVRLVAPVRGGPENSADINGLLGLQPGLRLEFLQGFDLPSDDLLETVSPHRIARLRRLPRGSATSPTGCVTFRP